MDPSSLLCSFISDMTKYLFLSLLPVLINSWPCPKSASVCWYRDSIVFNYAALLAYSSSFYSYYSKSSLYSFSFSSSYLFWTTYYLKDCSIFGFDIDKVFSLFCDLFVNSNEIELFDKAYTYFERRIGSYDIESVQLRKLSLSKAWGFFCNVFWSKSSLFIVSVAKTWGSFKVWVYCGSFTVWVYSVWTVPSKGSFCEFIIFDF